MDFKNKERDQRWAIDVYQADREKTFEGYSTKRPCRRGDHAAIRSWPGKGKGCLQCATDDMAQVRTREEAASLGQTYYRAAHPCLKGHDAVRYVSTGQCVGCAREYTLGNVSTRTPASALQPITRDLARIRGLTKFYTAAPCARGHSAERYVSTGICCECSLEYRRGTRSPPVDRPDTKMPPAPLGITRRQARELGFIRYTAPFGRPCKRGHEPIRYTLTGACCACLRPGAIDDTITKSDTQPLSIYPT